MTVALSFFNQHLQLPVYSSVFFFFNLLRDVNLEVDISSSRLHPLNTGICYFLLFIFFLLLLYWRCNQRKSISSFLSFAVGEGVRLGESSTKKRVQSILQCSTGEYSTEQDYKIASRVESNGKSLPMLSLLPFPRGKKNQSRMKDQLNIFYPLSISLSLSPSPPPSPFDRRKMRVAVAVYLPFRWDRDCRRHWKREEEKENERRVSPHRLGW